MKNLLKILLKSLTLLTLFAFCMAPANLSASGTWDGGGDGKHWDDPLNWDDDQEPTASDIVTIPSNVKVIIRMPGEVALALIVGDNATLHIEQGGELTTYDPDPTASTDLNGVEVRDDALLINEGTLNITNFADEGICLLGEEGEVKNFGNIIIYGAGKPGAEGIQVHEEGVMFNHAGGYISVDNSDKEAIHAEGNFFNDGTIDIHMTDENEDGLEVDATFRNNGVINFYGELPEGEAIDVDHELYNNGIINIGGNLPDEAIKVDNKLVNGTCGIINVTVDNQIKVGSNDDLTNNGIITTVYNGYNENDGTFTNNGEIRTASGIFYVNGPALVGSGSVGNGTIPAANPLPSCAMITSIPTMGEWSLFYFALIMVILGVVFVGQLQPQLQTAASAQKQTFKFSLNQMPFEMEGFRAALKTTLWIVPFGFALIYVGWGEIIFDDLIGMALAIPLVAYLIYLLKK